MSGSVEFGRRYMPPERRDNPTLAKATVEVRSRGVFFSALKHSWLVNRLGFPRLLNIAKARRFIGI